MSNKFEKNEEKNEEDKNPDLSYPEPNKEESFVKINEFPKIDNKIVQAMLDKKGQNFLPKTEEESLKNPIQGPFKYADGTIYLGQMMNNKKEGRGKKLWPDGSILEGYWKDDKAHGMGRKIHANGDVYEGEVVNNQANGHGRYEHYTSGCYHEGEWKDDREHGYGKQLLQDGKEKKGLWLEGMRIMWIENSEVNDYEKIKGKKIEENIIKEENKTNSKNHEKKPTIPKIEDFILNISEIPKLENKIMQRILEKKGEYLPPMTNEELLKNPIHGPLNWTMKVFTSVKC